LAAHGEHEVRAHGSGVAMSIEKIKDYYNMGNRETQEEGDWI